MYDCHAHLIGPPPHDTDWPHETPRAALGDYLAALDANGIAKGVLVQPRAHGFDNALILDAIAHHPDRLRGVAVVSADVDVATLRALHAGGIRGVRLGGKVALNQITTVAPNLARAGLHLQLLMRKDDLLHHHDAIAACPVPVVIDHLAHPDSENGTGGRHVAALDGLLALGHVHAKLSAVYRWAREPDWSDGRLLIYHLAERHPGQLVWGSDWPFLNQPSPGPSYAGLLRYAQELIKTPHRTAIFSHVPKVLYGF